MFDGKTATNSYQDTTIKNDGFWPDLNAGDFEKRRSIPIDLDADKVAFGLAAAVTQVNIELNSAKQRMLDKGIDSPGKAVGYPSIGDKNSLIISYESAVYALAKSMLISEFSSLTTKDAGNRLSENGRDIKDELQAEYQQHIRAIGGVKRVGISLL